MGAKAFESPSEISLGGHTQCTAGGDDSEQDAGAVSAFGAAGEEHVKAELSDVLELALGGRVVDGHERIVDEAEERSAVVLVVGNPGRLRLGREKRGFDRVEPALEVENDWTDVLLSMITESVTAEPRFCAFSSSPYMAPRNAPPSAASTG